MNQDELKQFWEDVASGIYCSSFVGWNVDEVKGDEDNQVIELSTSDINGATVYVTITVRVKEDIVKFVARQAANEPPMIDSVMGINLYDNQQEFVDAISSIVDDSLWDKYFGSGEEF